MPVSLPQVEPESSADPLAALAQRAKDGDQVALRALLDELAPIVFRVVCAVYGRGHSDLDDVTQTALLQIVRALRSFRGESRFSYFATRITLRTAIKSRRGSRQRQKREQEWQRLSEPHTDLPSRAEDRMVERCSQLWERLLEDLPAAQTETVVMRIILDYSLEQTAAATGVPFNTVRSRLRAALDRLRRRFDEDPSLADLLEER